MKKNISTFILIFEIIAIISLHAIKIGREAERLNTKELSIKNINPKLDLPNLKSPSYTLVSVNSIK
jgi:hypothetical protein